jgi:hypothetical protein
MEQKRGVSLFTKIVLIAMCYAPSIFQGFVTYFTRIESGDIPDEALKAALIVFIMLFALGNLAMIFICPILDPDTYDK